MVVISDFTDSCTDNFLREILITRSGKLDLSISDAIKLARRIEGLNSRFPFLE